MAYEDDYTSQLNLGSKSALQSAAPQPESGPPPGFGGLGTLQRTSMPTPPAEYIPGPTAPVRQEYENSMLFKIGSVLASYGQQVPANLKIKMAQQEVDLKQSENKLAWANYYKANELAQSTIQKHNQDMMATGLGLMPMAKDHIFMSTPDNRPKVTAYWKKMLDGFGPGMGDVATMMETNPGHTAMADLMLADKGPDGQAYRDFVEKNGYPQWLAQPQTASATRILGHDLLRKAAAGMPRPLQDKMAEGKLSEEEFLGALPDTMITQLGLTGQHLRAAQAYASGEDGQGALTGLGVELNSTKIAQQKKAKANASDRTQLRAEDYKRNLFKIQNADELGLSPEEVDQLKTDNRIFLGYESKANASSNAVNALNTSIAQVSKGKFQNWGDYTKALHEDSTLWALGEQAQTQAARMNPQGSTFVKQNTPVDISKQDVYEVAALQQGKLVNVKHPVTPAELASGKYITMEKVDKSQLQQLAQSTLQAHDLFSTAKQLFKAKTSWDVTKQKAVEADIQNLGWLGAAARHDPMWQVYVKQLNAWASTDARILGTERGVMTNTDIDRWTSVFPNASDTAGTVQKKIELFDKMVNYVVKTNIQVMSGTLDLADESASKKNRDTINGYLGSAEQFSKGNQQTSRGQSLLERMQKGTK